MEVNCWRHGIAVCMTPWPRSSVCHSMNGTKFKGHWHNATTVARYTRHCATVPATGNCDVRANSTRSFSWELSPAMYLKRTKKVLLDRRKAAFVSINELELLFTLKRHLAQSFGIAKLKWKAFSNFQCWRFSKFQQVSYAAAAPLQSALAANGDANVDCAVDCSGSINFEVGKPSAFVAQPQRTRARRSCRVLRVSCCDSARQSLRLGCRCCGFASAAVDVPHLTQPRPAPSRQALPACCSPCVRHSWAAYGLRVSSLSLRPSLRVSLCLCLCLAVCLLVCVYFQQ